MELVMGLASLDMAFGLWSQSLSINVSLTTLSPEVLSGSVGFWKNWDKHNTYPQALILAWLALIDNASLWLGPTTTAGMESVLAGKPAGGDPTGAGTGTGGGSGSGKGGTGTGKNTGSRRKNDETGDDESGGGKGSGGGGTGKGSGDDGTGTRSGSKGTSSATGGGNDGKVLKAKAKFLSQYLALRLNAQSNRIPNTSFHDTSGIDPGNYLGLPGGPGSFSLLQIIAAIEAKHPISNAGTPPTTEQYELMKDLAEAINVNDI
jgi:hypothetical protein